MSPESSDAIDAAAARWAARTDRESLSEQERTEFEAWASADPRRAGAYAKARAVNAYFDRAKALGTDFAPDEHPLARQAARRRFLAVAASVLALSIVGATGYFAHELRGREMTGKGDIRRLSLSDGSAVTLNTDTAIRADFSADRRKVELLHGEALFDVAKDAARPFIVSAGTVWVRAVGTSFTVRTMGNSEVRVLVREGVVDVAPVDGEAPIRIVAGNQAHVGVPGEVQLTALPAERIDGALAWRQGQIDLAGMTLAQAASEFSRYSDRRIRIDDPAVGRLKLTGVFSVSDPEGFAEAAALSLGLVATTDADGIRLSALASR